MIRRLAAAATGVSVVALTSVASVVAASATDYRFSSDCTAVDIQANNSQCVSSTMVMDVDAEANVQWALSSVFPRVAFDELIFDVERHTGTAEEYLQSIISEQPDDGAQYDYTLDDDVVSMTISETYTQASGDAAGVGVTLVGEEIRIQLEPTWVTGLSRVTVNTPGPVTESNGVVDGNSVVWRSSELVQGLALTARAETSNSLLSNRLLVGGIVVAVLAALAALSFLVLRKQPLGDKPHVDLDPVFEEDLDALSGNGENPTTHTEPAPTDPTTTDKPGHDDTPPGARS